MKFVYLIQINSIHKLCLHKKNSRKLQYDESTENFLKIFILSIYLRIDYVNYDNYFFKKLFLTKNFSSISFIEHKNLLS